MSDHPEAFQGWLLFATGWVRVCCARDEDTCVQLLLDRERRTPGVMARRVG